MKITVLSKWYQEEDLAPFFFNHYSFADEIILYLDRGTNLETMIEIKKCPKVKIVWGDSDGKLNDYDCVTALNKIAYNCKSDWLIYADADEFVFPEGLADPREVLSKADGTMIYSHMWNIYKHETDEPLDPLKPVIFQRRHGDPNIIPECIKPNVVKPEVKIHWGVGCHTYTPNDKIKPSSIRFLGAHWQSVDFNIACKRRIRNVRERLSQTNIDNLWASHNFNVTRESIAELMDQHKNDPLLF